MRHSSECVAIALSIPYGTPPSELAIAICIVRGEDPNKMIMTSSGPVMENWRVVLAETLMAASLMETI